MRKKSLLSLVFLALLACKSPSEPKTVETYKLPDHAISIKYQGHIYFNLNFDTIRGNYVFDTGADRLYHDSIFYADNGFNHNNLINGVLPGVGHHPQRVKVVMDSTTFSLQGRTFVTTMTPIMNLKPILGDFADGIVGMEFLKNSIVDINYEKEYVILHQNQDSIDLSSFNKIKLTKKSNRLYLPMSIKIKDSLTIDGDFILDLGSGGTVSLTSQTAKAYKLDEAIDYKIPYYTKYGGVGGESSRFDFNADSLWIGDFTFGNIKMSYSADKSGALSSGRPYIGILGNSILDRFDVVIDFIHNDLYLKPNSSFENPFHFNTTGFSFVNRSKTFGCWVVTGLYKGSNAEKANLKIDDRIIKINQIEIDSIGFDDSKALHQKDSLELTIRDKDQIRTVKFKIENQ